METRPTGIADELLIVEIAHGWGFEAEQIHYTPLGFGSHHWTATDPGGGRRFVTVDDLEAAARPPADAFAELARAFETASTLKDCGLEFVVGPIASIGGETIRRLDERYSIAVFPYVDGRAGRFADVMEGAERRALVDRLATLHTSTDAVRSTAPRRDVEPIIRAIGVIEATLTRTDHAWSGGPYSEPARHWLVAREPEVRGLIAAVERLLAQTARPDQGLVVTHGEPHPGNVIRTDRGLVLIDWDTVGLAPPERDLWMFADDDQLLARYTRSTGQVVDARAITLWKSAWTLSDLAVGLTDLRSTHDADEDRAQTWRALQEMRWSTAPS